VKKAERREDGRMLAFLIAAWGVFFLVVDPRGAFSLNDDFQYAECARRWLSGDGFRLPEWALSSTISHAILGAVATAPWGASNQALRFWMILLGGAGACGVYALARRWGAGLGAALLAAVTLAFSPLYATLSASFHLDVTAASLTTGGLLAFLHGREKRSLLWLAASSVLIAVSGLARQTGLLCVVGGAASLALEGRLTWTGAIALLLPAAAAAAGFVWWLKFVHGPTWAWECGAFTPHAGDFLRLGFPLEAARRASLALQTGALCLWPLAVLRLPDAVPRLDRREAAALAAVVGLALLGWIKAGGLPLMQNTLSHVGLGVVTLMGSDDKPAGWWVDPRLWHAAAGIALLSSATLLRAWRAEGSGAKGAELRAAALFVGAPFAAMLLMPNLYDRYLLSVLPAAAAAAVAGRKRAGGFFWPAAVAALILAAFTGAGLKDYFAWNRARWAAAQSLVSRGVPPEKIENGFDWDGQYTLTKNLGALIARKPAREIGMWEWQTLNRVVAGTTFSRMPPAPHWKLLGEFPYASPLLKTPGVVRLYGDPRLF
jgi:hypothetical protein